MKKLMVVGIAAMLVAMLAPVAMANTATQEVRFEVSGINVIAVSGDPAALVISTANAGDEPNKATDDSTRYRFTTNQGPRKITGAINANMPDDTTLEVRLAAAAGANGGTSAGDVSLSTAAADLVTGITRRAAGGLGIAYTLSADVAAGVVSESRTVTFTLTAG